MSDNGAVSTVASGGLLLACTRPLTVICVVCAVIIAVTAVLVAKEIRKKNWK